MRPNGDPTTRVPLLNAVVFPARSGEEYISPLDMGEESFKNAIAQVAMFGSAAIFQAQHGYQTQEGREHVRFQQGDRHERMLGAVEIHTDGTLFWQASIAGDDGELPYSMLRQYVINQNIVLERLSRFWSFSSAQFHAMKSSALISSVFASVSMSCIGHKYLGTWPDQEPNGMQMPMSNIDDPLIAPTIPMKLSRADLADGPNLAAKFLGHLLRVFRTAGREFGKEKMSRW